MKRVGLISLVLLSFAVIASAITLSLNYSAGQDTNIQTRLIPRYNVQHCRQYNLSNNCNQSQLGAVCTNKTIRSFLVDSCTIFAQTNAGEQAFVQELANQALAQEAQFLGQSDSSDFCSTFKNMSSVQQQSICSSMIPSLPSTCTPCP